MENVINAPAPVSKSQEQKLKKAFPWGKIICYLFLGLYTIWLFLPMYTILATSFTSSYEFTSSLEFIWLPKLSIEPYTKIFEGDITL